MAAGSYTVRWFREYFEKDETDDQLKAERIWSREEAEAIRDRCLGQTGTVSETRKPSKQALPLLFDLTSLQREQVRIQRATNPTTGPGPVRLLQTAGLSLD